MNYFAGRMEMIEKFSLCRISALQPKKESDKYNGVPVHALVIARFITDVEKHALREYEQMRPEYVYEELEVHPIWLN